METTVPLNVLIAALAALKTAMNQPTTSTTPWATYQALAGSVGALGYCVDKITKAQSVGVSS